MIIKIDVASVHWLVPHLILVRISSCRQFAEPHINGKATGNYRVFCEMTFSHYQKFSEQANKIYWRR